MSVLEAYLFKSSEEFFFNVGLHLFISDITSLTNIRDFLQGVAFTLLLFFFME